MRRSSQIDTKQTLMEVKRLKEENLKLKEKAIEKDAILTQCERKIRAYEGTAKE